MIYLLIVLIASPIYIYALLLSLKKPVYYMWLYLLVSTQFLGFVDFKAFEIQGIFNVMFYLNVTTILSIAILVINKRTLAKKGCRFLISIAGIFTFGVLYPVYLGYSTVASSVTDGKDFLCYSFLGYLLLNKNKIKIDSIYNVLTFIGLSLSIIVIIAKTSGLSPPAYLPINEELGPQSGIHVYFPTFISLAFFLQIGNIIKNKSTYRNIWIIIILFIGLLLQGHRSVFLATLAGTLFLIFFRGSLNLKVNTIFCIMVILTGVFFLAGTDTLSGIFVEPLHEILQGEGAIAARININYLRLIEIRNRPLLGHGFIDETSPFGEYFELIKTSRFNQSLGVVDSGYIDLLIRFGIIGTVILAFQYIVIITIPFRNKSYNTVSRLTSAVFLASYFIVSYTWSVFTYMHGIIAATLAIYFILSPNYTNIFRQL